MLDLMKLRREQQGVQDDLPNQPLLNHENVEPDGEFSCTKLSLSLIWTLIPILLIVYGVIHLHDCPAQNMISISMIVLGGVALVLRCIQCPYEFQNIFRRGDIFPKNVCVLCLALIFEIISISFYIAVSYWIFTINPDTKPEDVDSPNYCELQFYQNTYWGCVIACVISGILVVLACCLCVVGCVVGCNED